MRFFLDDVRDPPDDSWRVFRIPQEFLLALAIHWDKIDAISLDHDLGESVMTGYDVVCEIERMAHRVDNCPFEILVHSQNPVGRANIDRAVKAIKAKYAK